MLPSDLPRASRRNERETRMRLGKAWILFPRYSLGFIIIGENPEVPVCPVEGQEQSLAIIIVSDNWQWLRCLLMPLSCISPDQDRAILQKAMKQCPGEKPGAEEDGRPYLSWVTRSEVMSFRTLSQWRHRSQANRAIRWPFQQMAVARTRQMTEYPVCTKHQDPLPMS